MKLPASPSLNAATGYRVHTPPAEAKTATVTVEVPGRAGTVELPHAELDRLAAAYATLRGPEGLAGVASEDPGQTLTGLRADLNRSLFDSSPLMVTDAEARSAHARLMRASPAQLSAAIGGLDDAMLSRAFTELAEAAPFDLDAPGPSPLAELATKIALELDPAVAKDLVGRLNDDARRRLLEGVLQLPTGGLINRMRETLGDDGFRALVQGKCDDGLVGRGLASGRVYDENITGDFKTRYAAAARGDLPLPARAKETVFLTGPGLFGDQLPGYMDANARALVEWGVPDENVQKLQYNTADDPAVNADAIYAQVKAQHDAGAKVVLMGHSKFGRDVLEAMHRHPDLSDMVDGVVMMQPAMSAQIAKDLGRPELKKVLDPVLTLVGGNRGAFDGLSTPFEDLPTWPGDAVPTVVMASSTESPKALLAAAACPYYEAVYNAASDGAVSFQNQVSVEGAAVVTLPGVADHAQPGLRFADAVEHFAVQIEAGAPDDVVSGMLSRLRAMVPKPALLDAAIDAWAAHHDTPAERARCAKLLRAAGPALDRASRVLNRNAGYPLVENEPMTKALVSQLFERMA